MASEASPASRLHPTRPWVVVVAVLWHEGRVLLVQRRKAPRAGDWELPGGAQDVGETIQEAAEREVREETGVTACAHGVVGAFDMVARDGDGQVLYHFTVVALEARWADGVPLAGDDAGVARWATRDEALALVRDGNMRAILAATGVAGVAGHGRHGCGPSA